MAAYDEDSVLKRGRGRPRKREDNSLRFETRLGKAEKDMLEHMENASGKSKSDLARRAILLYYNANYGRW